MISYDILPIKTVLLYALRFPEFTFLTRPVKTVFELAMILISLNFQKLYMTPVLLKRY